MAKTKQTGLTADEELYLLAKKEYYAGRPIMDDPTFDALEDKLRSLDSFVIDIVGSKGKKTFIDHVTSMGSLAKIQFKPGYVPHKEFNNWVTTHLHPHATDAKLVFGPKLDGNAINCIYENGTLKLVLSRGDGKQGQDYTKKFKNKVPQHIKGFTGEIRGEAVIDVNVFDAKYKGEYKNARNFVAGILNRDYSEKESSFYDDIDFIAFHIVGFDGDTRRQLMNWGFEVLDFVLQASANSICANEKNLVCIYDDFVSYRETSKYQLDGIVCSIEESHREKIGANDHHPHWALAIKFVTEAVTTEVIGVSWTLGKLGQLTPVAILKPVELLGSTVQKASMYNADWMMKMKCFPGAVVSLIKSGDIIPKIVDIITPSDIKYALPTQWENKNVKFDGVQLMLEDFENTDQYKAIKLHNSITSLGIENIGPASCERLVEAGLDIKTLLSQSPDSLRSILLQSGKYKDGRELEILINAVFSITKVEFWQVIYAMGYKNLGKTIAKQLAKYLSKCKYDFKGLEKAVIETFISGQKQQAEVKEMASILLDQNIEIVKPEDDAAGLIYFEMTGDCTTHPTKKDFAREVEMSNKVKHSSLNKDTHYLVTESLGSNSGKMKKAEKQGTKIVTYEEFLDIVKNLN